MAAHTSVTSHAPGDGSQLNCRTSKFFCFYWTPYLLGPRCFTKTSCWMKSKIYNNFVLVSEGFQWCRTVYTSLILGFHTGTNTTYSRSRVWWTKGDNSWRVSGSGLSEPYGLPGSLLGGIPGSALHHYWVLRQCRNMSGVPGCVVTTTSWNSSRSVHKYH